jgi:ATP-dependent protease ClpP protease subunit
MNTSGGDFDSGITLYRFLKSLPVEVKCMHNYNCVDSAGILVFCAGIERYASPNTSFLFHPISYNFENRRYTILEMREQLHIMETEQCKVIDIISNTVGNNKKEEIENLILQRKVINSNEALKLGLVTDIKDMILLKNMEINYVHDDFYIPVIDSLNPDKMT